MIRLLASVTTFFRHYFFPSLLSSVTAFFRHCFRHADDLEDWILNLLDINTYEYIDDCTQNKVVPCGSMNNMQVILDAMNEWALRNKMEFNT